jgi:carbonic anhydrase/acetyltransferase-like protein (isoleucine patch superfamily)
MKVSRSSSAEEVIMMENALIRGRHNHPTRIGRHVIVGPRAHINGAQIADDAFIATGAALFPGRGLARAPRCGSTA